MVTNFIALLLLGIPLMWIEWGIGRDEPGVWLASAGQIFFTLSVGMGSLQAYASYLSTKDDIVLNGIATAATNETAEVILGGSIAIPAAVVFFGVAMAIAQSGSFNLGFATMPVVFQQLPMGQLLGAMCRGRSRYDDERSDVDGRELGVRAGADGLGVFEDPEEGLNITLPSSTSPGASSRLADRLSCAPSLRMGEDEVFVFFFSAVLAVVGMAVNSTARLHPLYFRGNPAPGIVRVGVLLAMGWIAYVLAYHADPSVTGVYVLFYLVMGYALVKFCGQLAAAGLGFRTRVDAGERRNTAAAVVIAVFILATGLIFGGSLWGEADPVGDEEGGWWIPATFFLLGWVTFLVAFALYQRREGRLAGRLRRERRLGDARAAAAFTFASAASLADVVAGDFWGWRHGLFSVGLLALLLLVHEGFDAWTTPSEPTADTPQIDARRALESLAYIVLAVLAWGASRYIDATWGAG